MRKRLKALLGWMLLVASLVPAQSVQISLLVPVPKEEGDDIVFQEVVPQQLIDDTVFPLHRIALDSSTWAHVFQLKIQLPQGKDSIYMALLGRDSVGNIMLHLEERLQPNEFREVFIPDWNQVVYAPQTKRASFCLLLSETPFSGIEKKWTRKRDGVKFFQKLIVKHYSRAFEFSSDLIMDKGIMIPWFFELLIQ